MLAQSYTAETVADSLLKRLHGFGRRDQNIYLHVKKHGSFALILEKENW